MSSVRMRRLAVVGTKSEQPDILELLTRSGCFEVSIADPSQAADPSLLSGSGADTSGILLKQAKVAFAIGFLNALTEEAEELNAAVVKAAKKRKEKNPELPFAARKLKKSTVRETLGYDDYTAAREKADKLFEAAGVLEQISFDRIELRSEIHKLTAFNRGLAPYLPVEIPFSRLQDTKTCCVLLASGLSPVRPAETFCGLPAHFTAYDVEDGALFGVVCEKKDRETVAGALAAAGLSLCNFTYNQTAKELTEKTQNEITVLQGKLSAKLREGLALADRLDEFKTLYDILSLDLEKAEAERDFIKTGSAFAVEGWVPETAVSGIEAELKQKTKSVYIETREPKEGDEPPTLLKNSGVVKPFEAVTNNYSPLGYGELDPNFFMGFFFFIFFGIMLGDAGYGLILAVGSLIVLRCLKLEPGFKQMIAMFGICGVAAIIFGVLTGGIFAIEWFGTSDHVLWFNPIERPMLLLVISLALGMLHLLTGYTLKMVKKIREGLKAGVAKKERAWLIFDGICDALFIYTLFVGIGFLAVPMVAPMIVEGFDPAALNGFPFSSIGMTLLLVTVGGILLTAGRESLRKKKIGGYITSGLSGLYGLVSLFSDILSYSRLFGLALSGAAIGMAFNLIGSMLFGLAPVVGYIVGGLVLAVLHLFNFALSALGAYVHNIRLQYLEFYGKFYDGGGRMFAPLGENTKYVRFVNKGKVASKK